MWFPVCEYDYAVWQTAEGRMQGQVQQTGRRSCIMRRRTGLSSRPGERRRWQEQDSSSSGKTQSHKNQNVTRSQNASDVCGESCWHGAAEHCFQFKHTPDWWTAGATSLRSTKPGEISSQHDWLFHSRGAIQRVLLFIRQGFTWLYRPHHDNPAMKCLFNLI